MKLILRPGDGVRHLALRERVRAMVAQRPCFHVWERRYGNDIRHPDGIRWRCAFCLAQAVKRPATLLDHLILAERGAGAPLVHPATVPAPRSTP